MKKPTKSIITSSLLAVAFGALSVGSTFALFTSQSKTEINVESGIVNVESKATLVNYSSTVDGTDHDFEGTETSYINPLVGNSFSINGENSIVTIDKMVPGDSLTISLSALNKSNVKTKTRLAVEHSKVGTQKDLFPALKFTFNAGTIAPADLFRWKSNDAVTNSGGVDLYGEDGILVTITFPDGDNGQILFGDANHDNQYQDAACSIAFSLQAVQGNAATSPIDEINAYLSGEMLFEGQNKTMYDAVKDMREIEYGLTNLDVLNGYVYDLANDRFVKESSVTANKLDYFKVCSSMPDEQSFSIYAVGNGWTTVEGLTVGFDAGDTSGITSIVYDRQYATEGQTVVIRTNGGTLTVNAPLDTVKHYGDADSVNIVAMASESYHENGKVPFIQISQGRIELEATADVNGIHVANVQTVDTNGNITKTENTFSNDVVLTLNGNDIKLTRDTIGTAIESPVLVCEVQENANSNEFIWLVGDGTIENAKVYVTETNETPNTAVPSTTNIDNASDAAIAIANNVTNTGTEENPVYEAVEAGTSAEDAQVASALKGAGTEENPFLVYDYETMQKISDFYDLGYYYFEVDLAKTDNGKIDLSNNEYIYLNGSLDGKGVIFTHVNAGMFGKVGSCDENDIKPVTLQNFTVQYEGGWGIVYTCGAKTLNFTNVDIVGYSLHNWNAGEFVRYGTGNGGGNFSFTINFNHCSCNAEIYSTQNSWSTILVGHTCLGGDKKGTINVDQYTDEHINDSILYYTGTGKSEGHKYYGMGGVEVFVDGVSKNANDNKVSLDKIVRVDATKNPTKTESGYSITTQEDTTKVVVTLLWQYTEWEDNYSKKIDSLSGVGGTIGKTLSYEVTGSTNVDVFDAITNVEIITCSDKWDYELTDGKLNLYMTNTNPFIDGNVTLFVEQFTSGSHIAKYKGSLTLATKTTSSEWVIK